jgi:hypothetical protein
MNLPNPWELVQVEQNQSETMIEFYLRLLRVGSQTKRKCSLWKRTIRSEHD